MSLTTCTSRPELELKAAEESLCEWLPRDTFRSVQSSLAKSENLPPCARADALFIVVRTQAPKHLVSLRQVQVVFDVIFRPLAKYVTGEEQIMELVIAICAVTSVGPLSDRLLVTDRLQIFATREGQEQIFFPAVQQITTPRACETFLQLMFDFSGDASGAASFATAEVRDRIFIPLAKYATTPAGQCYLLSTILELAKTQGEDSGLFNTPAVRDHIFVAGAKGVNTPQLAHVFFNALTSVITSNDASPAPLGDRHASLSKRAAVFRTHAMRDQVFVPLASIVCTCTPEPFLQSLTCVIGEGDDGGAQLFSTKAVRDRLLLPIVKNIFSQELAALFFRVLHQIASNCKQPLFATKAFCDRAILPLAKFATSKTVSLGLLASFIDLVTIVAKQSNRDGLDFMLTVAVRDKIVIPFAALAVSIGPQISEFVSVLSDRGGPNVRSVFANVAFRDDFLIPLALGSICDRGHTGGRLCRTIRNITTGTEPDAIRSKDLFAEVRDAVFCGCAAFVTADNDVQEFLLALLSLFEEDAQGARRTLFATTTVRDLVLLPLFEHATSPATLRCFRDGLQVLHDTPVLRTTDRVERDEGDGSSFSTNDVPLTSFKGEVLVMLAERTTSVDGVARLVSLLDDLESS